MPMRWQLRHSEPAASCGCGPAGVSWQVEHASGPGVVQVIVRAAEPRGEWHATVHVAGTPESYAECVDGFKIGPDSLACGLAAFTGKPVVTPDVTREPLLAPWLWLSERYGFRAVWSFPDRAGARARHRHVRDVLQGAARADGPRL